MVENNFMVEYKTICSIVESVFHRGEQRRRAVRVEEGTTIARATQRRGDG